MLLSHMPGPVLGIKGVNRVARKTKIIALTKLLASQSLMATKAENKDCCVIRSRDCAWGEQVRRLGAVH